MVSTSEKEYKSVLENALHEVLDGHDTQANVQAYIDGVDFKDAYEAYLIELRIHPNRSAQSEAYAMAYECFMMYPEYQPVSWTKWDDAYAPEGWKESGAEPEDIIFFKYTGKKSRLTDRQYYREMKKFYAQNQPLDYGEASKKRDEDIKHDQ